jgi:hypothetical protein
MFDKERKVQEKFVSLIKEKIPEYPANVLAEILLLEKDVIYRRLRGEVPFTFAEMAVISAHLGISLDAMANVVSPFRSRLYQLHVRDYNELKQIDLNMSSNYIKAINMAAEDAESEFGIAANVLPLHIGLLHLPIYRIYLLKWQYQFGATPKNRLSYAGLQVPKEEEETYQQYLDAVKKIRYTFFIWDNFFLSYLINDINFFYNIRMITREEMFMLKQEISRMLDTLEYYADYGTFDTGNKVEIYVSDLNFDTAYTYLSSNRIFISMSSVYNLGSFTSLEKDACDEMKRWIQGLKRSSNLISVVNQRYKTLFFKKQREILEEKISLTDG